jgi:hypothetical protein
MIKYRVRKETKRKDNGASGMRVRPDRILSKDGTKKEGWDGWMDGGKEILQVLLSLRFADSDRDGMGWGGDSRNLAPSQMGVGQARSSNLDIPANRRQDHAISPSAIC